MVSYQRYAICQVRGTHAGLTIVATNASFPVLEENPVVCIRSTSFAFYNFCRLILSPSVRLKDSTTAAQPPPNGTNNRGQ